MGDQISDAFSTKAPFIASITHCQTLLQVAALLTTWQDMVMYAVTLEVKYHRQLSHKVCYIVSTAATQ